MRATFRIDPYEPVFSVEDLNAELDRARRQGKAAVLYVLFGVVLTIDAFTMASSDGRRYYVALGTIGLGIIQAAGSNTRRNRAKALLRNAAIYDI